MINGQILYSDVLASFGLKVIAEPTSEQISVADARQHLNLTAMGSPPTHPDDNLLVDVYIPAAREFCEGETERALATQTLEMALNGFPNGYPWAWPGYVWPSGIGANTFYSGLMTGIPLPMSPVQQVVSVKYTDGDGNEQTLDPTTYVLDDWSALNVLNLASGSSWPTTQQTPKAVRITYVAGYALPGDSPTVWPLPRLLRSAMLLTIGHLYENRESTTDLRLMEVPLGISALLRKHTIGLSLA